MPIIRIKDEEKKNNATLRRKICSANSRGRFSLKFNVDAFLILQELFATELSVCFSCDIELHNGEVDQRAFSPFSSFLLSFYSPSLSSISSSYFFSSFNSSFSFSSSSSSSLLVHFPLVFSLLLFIPLFIKE